MKTNAARRRRLFAGLLAAVVPGAAFAVLAGPPATGANDPCAASEIARTVGSVSKSMGDYLDAHPETNQRMTTVLAQQADGAGGLPALPAAAAPPVAPVPGAPLGGPSRQNNVG